VPVVGSWWNEHIVDVGRLPLFLAFVAFVVTFVVTRLITRSIRSGRGPFNDNVSDSGLHIHHAVPGVILVTTGGFLAVGAHGQAGWAELAAVMVGAGASLVLDEFALILRLDDVYWSEEGRVSVELVALAAASLGLIVIGANPFRYDGSAGLAAAVSSSVVIGQHLGFVLITALKGKYRTALIGTFTPGLATIGAWRLARPDSQWARRRYDEEKLERARQRAERFDARWEPLRIRLGDLVGGRPLDISDDNPPVELDTNARVNADKEA
jgi:hypothetical protein